MAGVLLCTLLGCGEGEQPQSYRVPKPHLVYQANHVEPAAGHAAAQSAHAAAQSPGTAGSDSQTTISYDTPAGWTAGQMVIARGGITIRYRAAFEVVDGDRKVEITLSDFPRLASDPLGNINRWRGQVGLGPIAQDQLDQQLEPLAMGSLEGHYIQMLEGHYIQMTGPPDATPRETILAVMCTRGETVWFFKLKGDAALAEREKERFQAFAKSVKFRS